LGSAASISAATSPGIGKSTKTDLAGAGRAVCRRRLASGIPLMSGDWQELREFASAYVDRQIIREADREARAVLTRHRAELVEVIEAAMLRAMLADRVAAAERAERAPLSAVNGRRVARACVFKVSARQ
jgi:hypothetical protein